jgi:hypothetical protein
MMFVSRVQKNKEAKEKRKTLIYPIAAFVITAIILITAIDLRINNTFGTGGIRIIGVRIHESQATLSVFNQGIANIDFEFVKKDIMRLKRRVFEYVSRFENLTREVIKQD